MKISDLYERVMNSERTDAELKSSAREQYEEAIDQDNLTPSENLNNVYIEFVEDLTKGNADDIDEHASKLLRREKYDQFHINYFFSSLENLEDQAQEIVEQNSQGNSSFFRSSTVTDPFISSLIENYSGEELELPDLQGHQLKSNYGKDITVKGDIQSGPYKVDSGEVIIKGNAGDEFAFDTKGGKIKLEGDLEGCGAFNMQSGEVIINGDVAKTNGCDVRDGYIEVRGDVGSNLGNLLHEGEIIVEGDVGGVVGEGMEGGKIHIQGDAEKICHNTREETQPTATGGEIRVEGEIGQIAEENLQGVEIYQKQGNEWKQFAK
jgi:formylmethanofuran dehydrogenase subunit C